MSDGVLVIGYGSELRGDDGAGRAAARRLRGLGFQALDVHQLTPELAEPIAAARSVFFIDADGAVPPGEVSVKAVGAESAARSIEHHATPSSLLQLAQIAYGKSPQAWLVGLGCRSFDMGDALSAEAKRAVDFAVTLIKSRTT